MAVHLFCGFDPREAIGFHVFMASVLERTTVPVCFRRLDAMGLPQGSNAFTFSRFLVPHLMGYQGHAIFADASDMLMLEDIGELDRLFDPTCAVQVVQHEYRTRNPRKYIGTDMECHNRDYPRKNWASLMLINCAHPDWGSMTPERVEALSEAPTFLLALKFTQNIGVLPDRWNRLVDEGQDIGDAALLHWTAGIPAFKHYARAPGADIWREQRAKLLEAA